MLINVFIIIVSFIISLILFSIYKKKKNSNLKNQYCYEESPSITIQLDNLIDKSNEDLLKNLPICYLSTNVAKKMKVGKNYNIELKATSEATRQDLQTNFEIKRADFVEISFFEESFTDKDEKEFPEVIILKILRRNKNQRLVSLNNLCSSTSLWMGTIKPIKTGNQIIKFSISYYVGGCNYSNLIGNEEKELETEIENNFWFMLQKLPEKYEKSKNLIILLIGTSSISGIIKTLYNLITN